MAENQAQGGSSGGEVSTVHPDYDVIAPDWDMVRDAIAGETAVKQKTEDYLPMPSGFAAQDDGGAAMYAAYMLRGKFPEIMGPTLRGMTGIIHRIEAEIELPPQLEPLREKATVDGLSLTALHERITYELLATGRYGLLVDAPEEGADVPYIAGYKAETIINWSLDQDFYVLDETSLARDGFEWEEKPQFRVLEMIDEKYQVTLWETAESGNLTQQAPVNPQARGGKKFEEIPFIVCGSTDVSVDLDEIPLIGVARAAYNMYRLDTDYKWQLFMSGQETLFVYTNNENTNVNVVGAGVIHNLPIGSQAEYVGPSGQGIAAHKEAIEDERYQAVQAGAKMFDTERKAQESGEALKIRWAAQTASLTTVAINSAKGLERALKAAALFVGADPDKVSVFPNLRFIDTALDPAKAKYLMDLWIGGAISYQTLWDNLQRGDIGTYDRTWEEEKDLIDQELPDLPGMVPPTSGATPAQPKQQPAQKKAGNGSMKGSPGTKEEGQPA
jgi:hypothetical protein